MSSTSGSNSNSLSVTLTAEFKKEEVRLIGGYHHVSRGYMVEIESMPTVSPLLRTTVSFTDLFFPNPREEQLAFKRIFHLTIEQARQKGHSNGVPTPAEKLTIIPLDEVSETPVYELNEEEIEQSCKKDITEEDLLDDTEGSLCFG